MEEEPKELGELLERCRENGREGLGELLPELIEEVRTVARRAMAGENLGHTLETAALVNEAYMKLTQRPSLEWNDRKHFLCDLAEMMRRILLDHARRKTSQKRGAGAPRVSFDEMKVPVSDQSLAQTPPYLLDLEGALKELEVIDPDKYDVVMLRFYMGLTEKEIAGELGISVNTVQRRWQTARLWLVGKLGESSS